jgi:hypothetical protein
MKESIIEGKLVIGVKLKRGLCLKFVSPGNKGVPDRIVLYRGKIYFIELKATNGVCSTLQLWWHKQLRENGFKVWVINSLEQVKQFIDALDS